MRIGEIIEIPPLRGELFPRHYHKPLFGRPPHHLVVPMGKAEILSRIKRAEEDAENSLKKAATKAQNNVSKAKAEAAEILTDARTNGQENARTIIDDARAVASKEAGKVSAEGEKEIAGLKSNSESRRNAAVEVVISSFMSN